MKSMKLSVPFVEKYRPTVLDDVVGNTEAIERLKVISQGGNIPNLLMAGPPGCGKTTSIKCLARSLLGPSVYKEAILELNASDDRTLDTVRNKIKNFSKKKVSFSNNNQHSGRHKIIILDEADSMTKESQQALRRIMEVYSSTTRFALACNNSSKIIEPIQSRCSLIRFSKLDTKSILRRLTEIASYEKITVETSGYEALIFTAEGDMRNAINNLQATYEGNGCEKVTAANVFKICDYPHPEKVQQIINFCATGKLSQAHEVYTKHFDKKGYPIQDIIGVLARVVRKTVILGEKMQLNFLKEIGKTHIRIVNGVDTKLQLDGLLARLCKYSIKEKAKKMKQKNKINK